MTKPRLLIEEWLPAQAIGVECMRENSTGLHPPPNRLHVWWARRPLTVSRAAVLASLLPADYDHESFERLLGFGLPSQELVRRRAIMDSGVRLGGFGCKRAFGADIAEKDLRAMEEAMLTAWGALPTVADPMAGGGSIPLEATRLGLKVSANEYNPVACSVLEVTLDYPIRYGVGLGTAARRWGKPWWDRFVERMDCFFPKENLAVPDGYIYARGVPCPDTGHPTPLVPDWSLSRPKSGPHVVAIPIITDAATGKWTIEVRQVGKEAGQLRQPPQPTYARGKGWSLFTRTEIPSDYIKAMAQQGRMSSVLYAVITKSTKRNFRPAEPRDIRALEAAERQLARLRSDWERDGIIPTERIPKGDKTKEPLAVGMTHWADMFSPRQLLALGVLVEELRRLRPEIIAAEGEELGEVVVHLLAFVLDKFLNWNAMLASWNAPYGTLRSVFDRHDFSFKATFAEMAPCSSGAGLAWAIENVITAYEKIAKLHRAPQSAMATVSLGSATNLLDLEDKSVTAVVVDPPYADNVQYSELANFFYVWLKRTQGHRRPEWFSTYLCDHDEEAVVNISRHRKEGEAAKDARIKAHAFYQELMTDTFREAHRILRNDGVLTVMFTHKRQEAWADLFESLISAGFTITATWPIKTESQHSLHQARKNAAQSTVLLAARKREPGAGRAYFDHAMMAEITQVARSAASRLRDQGLNPVDQLVGAFGPAMEVFTRYDEVRTDTGEPVGVAEVIQAAANAVVEWRVEQLAQRGLEGVDAHSRFVLLCWDVLGASTFRFNEAMLLGRSAGMDVGSLAKGGLVLKKGANVVLLSAAERRRDRPIHDVAEQMELLKTRGRGRRKFKRQIHPNDELFDTAIDACHALALRYAEAGGGQAGIGAGKAKALQQGWDDRSPTGRLMEALVRAAPPALRFPGTKNSETMADAYPEFRAWHEMLKPLFGIEPPEWHQPVELQPRIL